MALPRIDTSVDHYKVMGVTPTASPAEIRTAWIHSARRLHPDAQPDGRDTTREFQEITASYEVLSDERARSDYDRARATAPRPTAVPTSRPGWAEPQPGRVDGDGRRSVAMTAAAVAGLLAAVFVRWAWSSFLLSVVPEGDWAGWWVVPLWLWAFAAAGLIAWTVRSWSLRPLPGSSAARWARLAAALVALCLVEVSVVAFGLGFVVWSLFKISEATSA